MADEANKGAARALVDSILAKTPAPDASPDAAATAPTETPDAAAAAPATESAPDALSDDEVGELIDVYFELEEPEERDALFDRLVAVRSPRVDGFLRVMMQEDEDEYMRTAAASELARRGDTEAVKLIEADLEEADDAFFFENAIEVLSELRGEAFYDALVTIWRDEERDDDQRRAAMVGMEQLATPRALDDFRAFIDATTDIETMPDDQIEVAMAAFARHAYTKALPALEALRERIRQAPMDDDEERNELVGFVDEGMALLRER